MEGAPLRISRVDMLPEDCAYGPLGGTDELRACVAEYYNRLYRRGAGGAAPYGPANVCVGSGGRLVLTRVMAALGSGCKVGYLLPDYTAYEDMLETHMHRLTPVPVRGSPEDGFAFTAARLLAEIDAHALRALLLSNPGNPTGCVIAGGELRALVDGARARGCTLILDEFYSHFIYTPAGAPGAGPVSAAAYVGDVERDKVIIIDGLTKNHRYPGWRVGWALG